MNSVPDTDRPSKERLHKNIVQSLSKNGTILSGWRVSAQRDSMNKQNSTLSRRELLHALSRLGLSGAALASLSAAWAAERPDPPAAAPAAGSSRTGGPMRPRTPVVLGYYPDWTMVE